MSEKISFIAYDGTSQAGRKLKALDPDYVAVDERSTKDLLAFIKEYAKELRYFNERNREDGDWSGFLGDINPDEIVAYLNNPQQFDGESGTKARFSRPHLALFLTFLKLLKTAREQLNDLTRRHLEFYFREALRLTSRAGVPDKVYTLAELADKQEEFLLPSGALFQAGKDALGRPVFFRSDDDLLANRASLGSVKSLFIEKKVIGIAEAREKPDALIEWLPGDKEVLGKVGETDRSFLAMLMMALGAPTGAALEPYPGRGTVNADLLNELDSLLAFVPDVLYLSFSAFRSLMALKHAQENTKEQWTKVNDTLEKVGQKRNANFKLDRTQPDNFEKNLLAAIGRSKYGDLLKELPEVEDIYGVYRHRDHNDVVEFIKNSLFMSVEDFSAMMVMVEEINGRWRQVYEILRVAGRKKFADSNQRFQAPQIRVYETDKFNALVRKTVGTIDYPKIQGKTLTGFDECHAKIIELESYFHLTAEDFIFIRKVNAGKEKEQPWEWKQVYAVLEQAHAAKALAGRRNELKAKREKEGFPAMILFALGDPNPGDDLPEKKEFKNFDPDRDKDYLINELFLESANFSYIRTVQDKKENATPEEWTNVYAILETAQRRKRKWTESPAEIEKWENIYAAQDIAQVQVYLDLEEEDVAPRWHTFGKGYSAEDTTARTVPGDIGFAIASPLLALAEGTRAITLTIGFREKNFDKNAVESAISSDSPFRVLLSTEKEMVVIEKVKLQLLTTPTTIPGAEKPYERVLQFTILLDEQTPAIAPVRTPTGIQSPWPVLQIMLTDLKPDKPEDGPQKRYKVFEHLALEKIHIKVETSGLTGLTLQNDNGLLDPKKPFEPFSSSPVTGSGFYFAHSELCSKKLNQLHFNFEWLGAPDNFKTYYLGYLKSDERKTDPTNDPATSPIADNTAFKVTLKLFDNRSFFPIGSIPLFNKEGASKPGQAVILQPAIATSHPKYDRELQLVTAEEVLDWSRYWQMELLAFDFQHCAYPRVAAGCANKVDSDGKPKPYIVNPPYTPKLKRLTIGYSASLELDLTKDDFTRQAERLYHIEPFGCRDLSNNIDKSYPFLPRFENEGELFIGLKNLKPPQSVSLLFQMADGSADPSLERQPIHWSYLDGDNWSSLEQGRLISDTTNGLLNAGIITFDLSPARSGTLLPPDQYWLRATIARNCRSVADIVAIHTQAVSAIFEDRENDPGRLSQPLPAGSITGLAEPVPQVKAVQQPYSSFNGTPPEQTGNFYTRVSERLRHKNRALTCWDYEHMVLDAFPGIYKVKCLPVGITDDPALADVVQVIVIADIRGKRHLDPFEPRLPADMLLKIEQYLIGHSHPFARLQVKNPTFVQLQIRLGMRLRSDGNPGYYKKLLNEELQRYLSPWAFDKSAEIVFGNRIDSSRIVNFVEKRPYVDYVAGIKLFTIMDGQRTEHDQLGDVAALTADVILVSARSHVIDLIAEEGYESEFFTGINYMMIELDFRVT